MEKKLDIKKGNQRNMGVFETEVKHEAHVAAVQRTGTEKLKHPPQNQYECMWNVSKLVVNRGVHIESTGRSLQSGSLISPDS